MCSSFVVVIVIELLNLDNLIQFKCNINYYLCIASCSVLFLWHFGVFVPPMSDEVSSSVLSRLEMISHTFNFFELPILVIYRVWLLLVLF